MKVILLQELHGRGGEGDVINVADGFANNYLLRQGIAVRATKGELKKLEQRRGAIAQREEKRIAHAEETKAKLAGAIVPIEAHIGEEGVLFGSVTAAMIAEAIESTLEVEIDRKRIELKAPLKTAGEHKVIVSLYRDIKAELTVNIVSADNHEAQQKAIEEVAEQEPAAEQEAETSTPEA